MSKVRVYELAKEIGVDSKEIIALLAKDGIEAKSQSGVEEDVAAKIKKALSKNAEPKKEEKPKTEAPKAEASKTNEEGNGVIVDAEIKKRVRPEGERRVRPEGERRPALDKDGKITYEDMVNFFK